MTKQQLQVGFIGGGNMAQAIIRGLLHSGHSPEKVHIADPSEQQRDCLADINSDLNISASNKDVASIAQVLVLAVKPQAMTLVLEELATKPRPEAQVIVSVAAGITLNSIQSQIDPLAPVVRVMPNHPALVNAGISVLIASGSVTEEQKQWAEQITTVVGQSLWIDDEAMMDAVTAISGSGPAYFYLLMEIMEECAQQLGLPAELAQSLVKQTAFGSGQVAAESSNSFSSLRASVTSPGGTTAAATNLLEEEGIRDIFRKALAAARDRSVELGLK